MEYGLAVVLILVLGFAGSLVLGFLYVLCCSRVLAAQHLPIPKQKNKNKKKYYNRVGGGDPQSNDDNWKGGATVIPIGDESGGNNDSDWNRDSGKSHGGESIGTLTATGEVVKEGESPPTTEITYTPAEAVGVGGGTGEDSLGGTSGTTTSNNRDTPAMGSGESSNVTGGDTIGYSGGSGDVGQYSSGGGDAGQYSSGGGDAGQYSGGGGNSGGNQGGGGELYE